MRRRNRSLKISTLTRTATLLGLILSATPAQASHPLWGASPYARRAADDARYPAPRPSGFRWGYFGAKTYPQGAHHRGYRGDWKQWTYTPGVH